MDDSSSQPLSTQTEQVSNLPEKNEEKDNQQKDFYTEEKTVLLKDSITETNTHVDEYADYDHIANQILANESAYTLEPVDVGNPAQFNLAQKDKNINIPVSPNMPVDYTRPTVSTIKNGPISFASRLSPYSLPIAEDQSSPIADSEPHPAARQENAIHIDRQPSGNTGRVIPVDLDSLMQQITHEIASDGHSVKYLLAGEPAFVDHGDRITMANSMASQNDEMILGALLVSRQQFHGRIELTGSEDFKQRAITLIAEYSINVKLKNPQQQLMLDKARMRQTDEPMPEENPTPFGSPVATIIREENPSVPASSGKGSPDDLPPELVPTILPREKPMNASQKESKSGLTGTLINYGHAKYHFDESESYSYFVQLRTANGERYVWGKELARVIPDSGLAKNDMVTLTWLGSKNVIVEAKVRDEDGNLKVDANGNHIIKEISTHRNQWEIKPAIDPQLLVKHESQSAAPSKLLAYNMLDFVALQLKVNQLARESGVTPPPPSEPELANGLVWLTPNGRGTKPPHLLPSIIPLPTQTSDAGTLLMKATTDENQLKLLLVKSHGDYIQGVVHHKGEYRQVLGKLCTTVKGHRYLSLNAITPDGITQIGHGNAVNHEAGANSAFVFRLNGEKERLYAPLVEPGKYPPELHKQLGFAHPYSPPPHPQQSRDEDNVENTIKPAPQAPCPGR